MQYSVFMEEFEDWQDQDIDAVNFNDSSSEERLMSKLKSGDHYFRKQGFNDLFPFLQHNTNVDIYPSVFDTVQKFSFDDEPSLRCDFAESLITITKIAISKTVSEWSCVSSFTVPCIAKLLHDTNKQVRLASHATVIFLLENNLMNKELFLKEINSILEEIMVSYNPDELRTECFTLLVQVSQVLNHCLEDDLLKYCRDFINTNDNLRKTCASHLLSIINGCSDSHLSEWLDLFYKLSDDTSWYVKKFCIECAVSLSNRISPEERWHKLAPVYHHFMTDSKKWVTTSAFQNFGAFVRTFSDPAKAHCKITASGQVVSQPFDEEVDGRPSRPVQQPLVIQDDDSDLDSAFGTTVFWQQPIDDGLTLEVSPLTCSLKNIDIDPPEHFQYSWPPDLSDYKQTIVPPMLLQCYSNTIHEVCDTDLIRPCAYSMPAVLVTLGPRCWPHIRPAYVKLVQFMSWKVRLCLAASLHHVFHVFRHEREAVTDLLWAYRELIKDVDEVKVGLMANLADFYLALPVDRLPVVFEDFADLVRLDNGKNWRYRVMCMQQLQAVVARVEVTSSEARTALLVVLTDRWLPVVFEFSLNDVCAVRAAAADVLIETLKRLVKMNPNTSKDFDGVIKSIQDKLIQFSESDTWYIRQLFLQSAVKIVKTDVVPPVILDTLIMPKYLYLCCWDGVPNNRLVGGHGLTIMYIHGFFDTISDDMRKMIENVYHQLKVDKDRDVRESVAALDRAFATVTTEGGKSSHESPSSSPSSPL